MGIEHDGNLELEIFEIGGTWDAYKGVEGHQIDYMDDGIFLVSSMHGVTEKEYQEYKDGDFKFKITMYDGIIFILFKVGALPWQDVPFNIHLAIHLTKEIPEPGDKCYGMKLFLVEATTGEIKAIKLISLPNRQSRLFYKFIQEQKKLPPVTPQENQNKVNEIYKRYTTKELLDLAY